MKHDRLKLLKINIAYALSKINRLLKKFRLYLFLILILLIAFLLRTYRLGSLPFAFQVDELFAGYIGRYMILHNGVDISGHHWSLYYDSFGDFRPIGIFFLAGISTLIFGVNEFAVRFPTALFGTLTILCIYLLTYLLYRKKSIAIYASLLLAIAPWHIVLSRATAEGVIGLFFMTLGLSLLILYLKEKIKPFLWIGITSLVLTYLFYHAFRLLVPLIILPLYYYPKLDSKQKRTILLTFCFSLALSISLLFTKMGSGRLNQVSIINSPHIKTKIIADLAGDGPGHIISARIFHNKLTALTYEVIGNYFEYYSPTYLFIKGGLPDRYVVQNVGLLPIISLIFLLMGFVRLVRRNLFEDKYLFWLLAISPLPAALTYEDIPNIHRSISLVIPLIIICAVGLNTIIEYIRKNKLYFRSVIILVAIILSSELIMFWHMYMIHEKSYKSFIRNDMFREMVIKVDQLKKRYNTIYLPLNAGIPLYYLFYSNQFTLLPSSFLPNQGIKGIGNINFIDNWCPTEKIIYPLLHGQILIVNKGDCPLDKKFNIIEELTQSDGAKAFILLETK